jgi:hypothetical protein
MIRQKFFWNPLNLEQPKPCFLLFTLKKASTGESVGNPAQSLILRRKVNWQEIFIYHRIFWHFVI